MLAVARDSAERLGLQVRFVHGDAEALPFERDAFDAAIYACNGIGHLTAAGKGRALRELARVIRPGGAALLSARTPYALNRMLPGLLVRGARQALGGPDRDELSGPPYVHRPSVRTMERLVREAGLELVESTSHRVLERGGRPGAFTRYVGGQFFLAARVR
jgi:SAM-dependent methyltransferase